MQVQMEHAVGQPIFVGPAPAGQFCATVIGFANVVITPMATSPKRTILGTTSHVSGQGRTYYKRDTL